MTHSFQLGMHHMAKKTVAAATVALDIPSIDPIGMLQGKHTPGNVLDINQKAPTLIFSDMQHAQSRSQ